MRDSVPPWRGVSDTGLLGSYRIQCLLCGLLTYACAMTTMQGLEAAIADLDMCHHFPQPAFASMKVMGPWQ